MQENLWDGGNKVVGHLARHSIGRKVLSRIGSRFITKPVRNFEMVLDLNDQWGVSKYILKHGDYDNELCQYVKRYLKPGATCLDIGGNIGFWTCFLTTECGARKVFAFEPAPENTQLFQRNLKLNRIEPQTVQLFAVAVGDQDGELTLHLSDDNAGDHQVYSTDESRRQVQVPVRRVDSLVSVEKIDFIKMDVQGYEPFVIKGMRELLERNQDVLILTEYWIDGIKRAAGDPAAMLEQLANIGFKFHLFDGDRLKIVSHLEIPSYVVAGNHLDLLISRRTLGS